ncbi:hypothetical protein HY251_18475, partial [bacterium]|nr:hypothetical protein [bacterium]
MRRREHTPARRLRKRRLATAAALAAAACALVFHEPRARAQQATLRSTADVELAPQSDLDRLQAAKASAFAGDARVLSELEELLARTSHETSLGDARNPPGEALVQPAPDDARLLPLRTAVLEVVLALPSDLRGKLAQAQANAVATERSRGVDDEEHLIRRYPLMPGAADIARKLAERAFEAGDDLGAASLDRLSRKLERLRSGETAPLSRGALTRKAVARMVEGDADGLDETLARLAATDGARGEKEARELRALRDRLARERGAARGARALPEKASLVLSGSYAFTRKEPRDEDKKEWRPPQSPVAAHVGDLVFASDGSRLLAVDARTGELKGRLPQDDDESAPLPSTIPGTVTSQGELVLAPIFFESFLLPARESALEKGRKSDSEDADPSVRGGFLSLCAFDASTFRLLWWDGDAGTQPRAAEDAPHGRPAGAETACEDCWRRLARAHVVGRPLMDGKRVYVPLATSGSESQVWIAAYERSTGESQPLALTPA